MKHIKSKFTMLELVIVAIVLLGFAGMLMPVLNAVQLQGKDAACANNLKQNGAAIAQYFNDKKGFLINQNTSWYAPLYEGKYLNITGNPSLKKMKELAAGVIKTPVLHCPAAPVLTEVKSGWEFQQTYAFDGLLAAWYSKKAGIKKLDKGRYMWDYTKNQTELKLMLLTDGTYDGKHEIDRVTNMKNRAIIFRHNNRAPLLFTDGSVAFLSEDSIEMDVYHGENFAMTKPQ